MSSAVREKVEAYFASLNSTSSRIMADINSVRQGQGVKWDQLTEVEQSETLWQSLVKPEVTGKYEFQTTGPLEVEYFPILRITPGEKIVVDEDTTGGRPFGSTWRDEHSAPFHWETQSQLDLRLCGNLEMKETSAVAETEGGNAKEEKKEEVKEEKKEEVKEEVKEEKKEEVKEEKKEEEVKRPGPLKRPEVPPPPVPPHATPPVPPHVGNSPPVPPHAEKTDTPIYAKVIKRKSSVKTLVIGELRAHKASEEEQKPEIPPRMSLELKGDIMHSQGSFRADFAHSAKTIPKTGFDFLDNW